MEVPRYRAIRHPKLLRVRRRDVFCKLWTGLFYGLIYVHFISGVFMYFSPLFVLVYGRLYLLNNVQYLIVMTSANKIKIKTQKT